MSPQLAQVNVARMRFPAGSAELAEFVGALERINLLAERSPGFVWRYDEGHLNGAELVGDARVVVNVSVWECYAALHAYVYRSAHGGFVRRRTEWCEAPSGPTTALWWVRAGHRPTPAEALARHRHLLAYGPTPQAFGVRTRFTPDGRREAPRRRQSSIAW